MDDDNIDIEDVQQAQAQAAQDEQQQQQQQQQQAVVLLKKMILVLEQKETFPLQTRDKTDELVENFLENLEDDVHEMLCSGLDSDRDTEAEVEAILRVFPAVLTREIDDEEVEISYYPIQLLAFARKDEDEDEDGIWGCNVKAVAFIPLLARLAIELGLFEADKRGGLLFDDDNGNNVLHLLMLSDYHKFYNQEHHDSIDTKYLQVLMQLRSLGFLKKEDIQRYDLLHRVCYHDHFAEKRFRFMVEWDPSAVTQTNEYGQLPIHRAFSNIQGFRSVFEAGIRYYPKKKGISLLFRKDKFGETPFVKACVKFGREKVMKAVEDTLIRCCSSSEDTPSLNAVEAFMMSAINEDIHLDCVYFLLRRQPDILQKLLSSASSTTIATVAADSNNNGISQKKSGKERNNNNYNNNNEAVPETINSVSDVGNNNNDTKILILSVCNSDLTPDEKVQVIRDITASNNNNSKEAVPETSNSVSTSTSTSIATPSTISAATAVVTTEIQDNTQSGSELAPFVGASVRDRLLNGMNDRINLYKSKLTASDNERLVVEVTGLHGSPIYFEGSFRNALRRYGDDRIVLRFNNGSRDGFPLSSLGKIEIRLGGVVVQRINIDDLNIYFYDDAIILGHAPYDEENRMQYICLLHNNSPHPSRSGPIECVFGKIGPLPLGWRQGHVVGDEMLLTDFLERVADETNDLTPQTLIINALVFDAKDITGIMSLVEE